jgi:tetratricopeptide (TPR) repeat protein
MAAILHLILLGVLLTPQTFAQQPSDPAVPPAMDRARGARVFTLSTELQSRLQALESAKRAGDPAVITTASRSVVALALREMGDAEFIQASAPAAMETYRRSLDFENSLATRTDLALAYLQALRLDESLSAVTDVLVADPENARAWYVQGKVWMAKNRYDNAVTSFSRVLSLQDDPAASYLLGAAFLQLKETEKAKEVFRKLSDTGRGRAGIHLQLADAYRAANDTDNFSREVRLAGPGAKAKPLSSSPMDSVMADAAQLGSSFETVKPTQQEHARIGRLQVELRTLLASAFNDLGTAEARQEQYSIALAHFHEAAGWNADIAGLPRNTGIAAGRAMDYPDCIRALRPVVAKNPQDNVARAMLGTALFATHSYADAVQVFTPLGDSVLQLHELAYSWAASLVQTNKYGEATALLNKLEQQQLSTETLMLVAQLWSQMANYEHAVQVCRRALQLDPTLPRAHYTAGLALLRLNRSADAEQEFRDELQLDETNVDAQFHLAFSLLQQSKNDQAVEFLKKVLATQPDHAEANYELGKELRIEGKAGESLSYLEAAVRLKPGFEPAHYQLQSAYRTVGRSDDADREARIYRALKTKSRNITLPPPRKPAHETPSSD